MVKSKLTARDEFFNTDHLTDNLRTHVVRGGAATIAGQVISFILRIVSTMVLARLIIPDDFGLIAMVVAMTGFVYLFKDLGLSMATIQRSQINQEQTSMLFWVNVTLGLALTLMVVLLAPLVALFYNDGRLTSVTQAIGLGLAISALGVQHQALLRRQMKFFSIAVVDISSQILGIIVAVIFALKGYRYWALIAQQLATALANAILSWMVCPWKPDFPKKLRGLSSHLQFGGNITGFNVVNYFARNLDNLLIGRFYGSQQLGFYNTAYNLLMLPIQQVNAPIAAVAVPALSRLQDRPEEYCRYYLKALSLIALATMPFIAMLTVLSKEFILLVLGDRWIGASQIFSVLGVAAFFQPIGNTVGWVYISLDQTGRMARWGLVTSSVIVLSFFIGLPWGTMGVAVSYTVAVYVLRYPSWQNCYKHSPITTRIVFESVWRPAAASIFCAGVVYIMKFTLVLGSPIVVLIVCFSSGAMTYAVSILLWPKLRTDASKVLSTMKAFKQ